MQGYPTYKDSGNSWFGQIPDHWMSINFRLRLSTLTDFTANGSFASLAKNVNYLEEGFSRLVRLTDLRINLEGKGIYVSEDAHNFLKKSELYGGEILLANVGAYAGLITRMPYKEGNYTLGPNMFLIRVEGDIDFYTYLLSSYPCNEQLMLKAMSAAQPKLNKEDVRSIRVAIPSDDEQQSIANFLDHKTTQIDQAIADKQRLLELYEEEKKAIINQAVTKGLDPKVPMKESGVEWLGEIPEHWEVTKIKYTSYLKARVGWKGLKSDEFLENGYSFLVTGTDFKNGRIDWENCYHIDKERYEDDPFIQLRQNDLLITKDGTIGKLAIVSELIGLACLNSGIFVMRPLEDCYDVEYLYYVLDSNVFSSFNEFTSSGATILHLYQNVFNEFQYALPSIDEQKNIVSETRKELTAVENLKSSILREIDLLKEYKQSLTFEAVTGKIDVRDFELKDKN